MSHMVETANLCRVCSSTGLYGIHNPIPFYLHSNVNEFSFWTKSIALLINEVTGSEISKDDGLPQKICTICISYLKHAVNFRQQVLTNSNHLRTSIQMKATDLQLGSTSPLPTSSDKFYPINETNVNKVTYENLKAELDLFFEDNNDLDTDDDSDDDQQANDANEYNPNRFTKSDTKKTAIHNFFNYSEKIFEEDDLSDFDRLEINQPDEFKEKKCHACKCRFMLLESYESHMKECIQAKLVSFITDCHQLLIVKKHKAVSTAEFMRRMIFSLKNIVKSLAMSYRVITKRQQPLKDTNPDVIRNENIFTGFDERLFHAPDGSITASKKLRPILKSVKPPSPLIVFRDVNLLPKGLVASSTPKSQTAFAAKCTMCKMLFNGIGELEKHNRQIHNAGRERSSSTSSNRSFGHGAFQLDDDDYLHEGIVDVLKLRRRSPNIVNIELNSNH